MKRSILLTLFVCSLAMANEDVKVTSESLATFRVDKQFLSEEFSKKNNITCVKSGDEIEVLATPKELPAENEEVKRVTGKLDEGGTRANSTYAPGTRLCQTPYMKFIGLSEDDAFRECWNTAIRDNRGFSEGSIEYLGLVRGRAVYMCYGVYPCRR